MFDVWDIIVHRVADVDITMQQIHSLGQHGSQSAWRAIQHQRHQLRPGQNIIGKVELVERQ
jgi:hypothetical protein